MRSTRSGTMQSSARMRATVCSTPSASHSSNGPSWKAKPQRMARSISTMRSEISGTICARIQKEIAKQRPQEVSHAIITSDENSQALAQVVDAAKSFGRRKTDLVRGVILESLEGLWRGFPWTDPRVCRSLGRAFRRAPALDHRAQEGGHAKALARRIVRSEFVEIVEHVRPDVEPDDVHQPEACALRQADQRTGKGIHFLHRVRARGGQFVDRRARRSSRCDWR